MGIDVQKTAEQLYAAERGRYAIDKFSVDYPDMTLDDSYEIQERLVAMRLADGERQIGWKIGLTSKAVQAIVGYDKPDFGYLTDAMVITEGEPFPISELVAPMVEGEIVFFVKKTLKGPGVTIASVYDAVDYVAPALEIVDSRITNWDLTVYDNIADNASCGRVVIGSHVTPITDVDMRLTGMTLEKNGELMNSGTTAEVLGNPAAAVAWLANALAAYGKEISAGSIVYSGALTACPPAKAGDTFVATFHGLGSVRVRFI